MTLFAKTDLVRASLLDISALDIDETPEAADETMVEEAIQQIYEQLVDENLMVFDHSAGRTEEIIPARLFMGLVDLVVDRISSKYGLPRGQVGPDGMTDRERSGMKKLRRGILSADNDVPVQAEYF